MSRRCKVYVVMILLFGVVAGASFWRHITLTVYTSTASYQIILLWGTLYIERAAVKPLEFYHPPGIFDASATEPPEDIFRGFFPYLRHQHLPAIWADERWSYASVTRYRLICLPLWLAALPFASVGGLALARRFRARHRLRRGNCANCGYSLQSIPPNSPCPECGRQPRRS